MSKAKTTAPARASRPPSFCFDSAKRPPVAGSAAWPWARSTAAWRRPVLAGPGPIEVAGDVEAGSALERDVRDRVAVPSFLAPQDRLQRGPLRQGIEIGAAQDPLADVLRSLLPARPVGVGPRVLGELLPALGLGVVGALAEPRVLRRGLSAPGRPLPHPARSSATSAGRRTKTSLLIGHASFTSRGRGAPRSRNARSFGRGSPAAQRFERNVSAVAPSRAGSARSSTTFVSSATPFR